MNLSHIFALVTLPILFAVILRLLYLQRTDHRMVDGSRPRPPVVYEPEPLVVELPAREVAQSPAKKLRKDQHPTDKWKADVIREAQRLPESERRAYLERAAYAHLMGEWMDRKDPEMYKLANDRQPPAFDELPTVCDHNHPRKRRPTGWMSTATATARRSWD